MSRAHAGCADASEDRPGLCFLVNQVLHDTEGEEQISLGEVIDTLSHRGFGPILMLAALVVWLPTGAIPTVPSTMAVVVILASVQLLCGRTRPWLPGFLRRLHFRRARLVAAIDRFGHWLARIDAMSTQRMTWLSGAVGLRVVAAVSIVVALVMMPLEIIPWADAAPATTLLLLGLGLSVRDGAVLAIGLASVALTAWVATMVLL